MGAIFTSFTICHSALNIQPPCYNDAHGFFMYPPFNHLASKGAVAKNVEIYLFLWFDS